MAADSTFQLKSNKSDEANDVGEEIKEENKSQMSYKFHARSTWQNPKVMYHIDDADDANDDEYDECGL
ncbi:hypothetical protein Tco_1419471 [Tanacetum coccineum]